MTLTLERSRTPWRPLKRRVALRLACTRYGEAYPELRDPVMQRRLLSEHHRFYDAPTPEQFLHLLLEVLEPSTPSDSGPPPPGPPLTPPGGALHVTSRPTSPAGSHDPRHTLHLMRVIDEVQSGVAPSCLAEPRELI